MNYKELQKQLYSLLTKDEREESHCYVSYDIGISTMVFIGEDDIECVFRKSPYRDHIIGFKRGKYTIYLVLDDEGQKKWDEKVKEIERFYGI